MTGMKEASERIVASGGASTGRIRRRAAANTNAFSITLTETPRWKSCVASTRSGRRTVPIVPGVLRYASKTRRIYSSCSRPSSMMVPSTLQFAQRRAVDAHRMAVVAYAAQQCVHHRFIAEEVMPLVIDQIGCNDRGMAMVPLLHQFEKDVALLGLQGQISKFVD